MGDCPQAPQPRDACPRGLPAKHSPDSWLSPGLKQGSADIQGSGPVANPTPGQVVFVIVTCPANGPGEPSTGHVGDKGHCPLVVPRRWVWGRRGRDGGGHSQLSLCSRVTQGSSPKALLTFRWAPAAIREGDWGCLLWWEGLGTHLESRWLPPAGRLRAGLPAPTQPPGAFPIPPCRPSSRHWPCAAMGIQIKQNQTGQRPSAQPHFKCSATCGQGRLSWADRLFPSQKVPG